MNKPLREHYETPTDAGSMLQTFRYIDDLEKYIEYLEHKPAQLQQHSVVRGGDFESKSVSRDQVISKKETSELTPNTPTEPLGNEGLAKSVCGEKPAHHWITLKDGDICCSECGLIFRA